METSVDATCQGCGIFDGSLPSLSQSGSNCVGNLGAEHGSAVVFVPPVSLRCAVRRELLRASERRLYLHGMTGTAGVIAPHCGVAAAPPQNNMATASNSNFSCPCRRWR